LRESGLEVLSSFCSKVLRIKESIGLWGESVL
jgi:hypothetical protein